MTFGELVPPRPASVTGLQQVAGDLALGGAIVVGLWLTVAPSPGMRAWQLVLAGLCLIAVALRRRFPIAATVIAALSTLAGWTLGVSGDLCVMAGVCLFAVAEQRSTRLLPWWLLTAGAAVGAAMLVVGGTDARQGVRDLVLATIVLGAAWALGTRSNQVRRASAQQARASERLRLSREVHDVLSHSLGTIGVQAGVAAHVTSLDEDALRSTLGDIETQSRSSLEELRDLLQRQREDSSGATGAPLPEIIRGLALSLERAGVRPLLSVADGAEELPVVHQLTIRRIVQEAITNVIRHSGASTCQIDIDVGRQAVTVSIRDNGKGTDGGRPEGQGLTGLRERVEILGGRIDLQDDPNGFHVVVQLPLSGQVP